MLTENMKRLNNLQGAYSPPFGYELVDGEIVANEEDLEVLEEIAAMIEMKALSLRDGALWLTTKCSRSISAEGLRKRLKKPVRIVNESEQQDS